MFRFDSTDGGRPADRIPRVLAVLEKLWTKYPQLRLGQLLVNVDPRFEARAFFVEDDELEADMRKLLDKGFGGE